MVDRRTDVMMMDENETTEKKRQIDPGTGSAPQCKQKQLWEGDLMMDDVGRGREIDRPMTERRIGGGCWWIHGCHVVARALSYVRRHC